MKTHNSKKAQALTVGDAQKDGTIFAGISPDKEHNMFVTPQDTPNKLAWEAAMTHISTFNAHGHADWVLPTQDELDILYKNRNKGDLKGTFNKNASDTIDSWYWSCKLHPRLAQHTWVKQFNNGYRELGLNTFRAHVRPVRLEPRPQQERNPGIF